MKLSNFSLLAEMYIFAIYTNYYDVTVICLINTKYYGKSVPGFASKVAM